MRLIDADALKIDIYDEYETEDDAYAYGYVSKHQIDMAPTIDAVEVVHGEWIKRHGTINCSVCKRSNWSACFEDTVRSFNFCPNCGAKMKGEDDEMR